MTIVNARLARDGQSARLITDSLGGPPPTTVTKIFALPHMDAVLSGRGRTDISAAALGAAMGMPSFDSLRSGLGGVLSNVWAELRGWTALKARPLSVEQEIVVVGWSDSAARFRIFGWRQCDAATGFQLMEGKDVWLSPWDDDLRAEVRGDVGAMTATVQGLVQLCKIQHRECLRRFGDAYTGGGSLYVAEIERGRLTVEWAGELSCE